MFVWAIRLTSCFGHRFRSRSTLIGDNDDDDEPTIVRASAVDGSLEWDAVRGLRLWAAGGFVRCDKRTRDAAANGMSIGASNERKAFGAVVDAAALALTSTLATTAKDDLDVLTRCRAARWGDDGEGRGCGCR